MAASPAEWSCAWGVLRVNTPAALRAYDEEKTCFSFLPFQNSPCRYAIDVELRSKAVPEAIGDRLGSGGLAQWTEIEVVAKLTNTPAHLVFRRALASDLNQIKQDLGIEMLRCDTASHFIAIGRRLAGPDDSMGADLIPDL